MPTRNLPPRPRMERLTPPDIRSVGAKRQARYRVRHKEEKDFPRKRCQNCPKFFRQNKPTRRFCSRACKNQFNRWGTAYGKLREDVVKLMPKFIAEALGPSVKRILTEVISAEGLEIILAAAERRRARELKEKRA